MDFNKNSVHRTNITSFFVLPSITNCSFNSIIIEIFTSSIDNLLLLQTILKQRKKVFSYFSNPSARKIPKVLVHASSDTRHRERFIRVANERPSPRDLIKKTIINQPDNSPRPTSANTSTGSQSGRRRQWGSRSSKPFTLGYPATARGATMRRTTAHNARIGIIPLGRSVQQRQKGGPVRPRGAEKGNNSRDNCVQARGEGEEAWRVQLKRH